MKLGLIGRQFSRTGGVELYTQRLLEALVRRGHEVHFFAENWGKVPDPVQFHPVQCGGARAVKPLRFAEAMRRAVDRNQFDCVFSLERTYSQDVHRAGGGVHQVWLERRKQFAPWWNKPFVGSGGFHRSTLAVEAMTYDLRNTGRVIVNSEMVRREILEYYDYPADRIHLVRNGVDIANFQNGDRDGTRKRYDVQNNEYLLLFVGSGWERKGLDFVIRSLRHLNNGPHKARLLVVGKGRKPWFAARDVIFAGAMSDLKDVYAAADLFVFPPIYEPSANVVFEALAAGLPVVTSVYNGAGEVILENVTGNLVEEFWRPETLAGVIRKWMERPGRVKPDIRMLDLERNVTETLAVLEMAILEKTGLRH